MLDALVDTLLYEGYALYPYTPGATKNATPTPFGIVYPPVYAAGSGATFDQLQIQCLCDGDSVSGEVHFLQASGVRHQGDGAPRRPPGPGRARVRLRRPPRPRLARLRGRAHDDPRREPHRGPRRASTGARRCGTRCSPPTSSAAWPGGRFVSPLEAGRLRADQLVAGARHAGGRRRARRRDHAPRPPADRAGEQGQPVRLDRDRGGAADPRARAVRRGARGGGVAGPGGAADARARGADDAAGADGPPRARARSRTRARASRRPRSTGVRLPARRQGRAAAGGQRDAAGPPRRGAPRRRSSASTTTTTAPCTSRSPSTTSPART